MPQPIYNPIPYVLSAGIIIHCLELQSSGGFPILHCRPHSSRWCTYCFVPYHINKKSYLGISAMENLSSGRLYCVSSHPQQRQCKGTVAGSHVIPDHTRENGRVRTALKNAPTSEDLASFACVTTHSKGNARVLPELTFGSAVSHIWAPSVALTFLEATKLLTSERVLIIPPKSIFISKWVQLGLLIKA